MISAESDAALMQRVQAGEGGAFARLYDRFCGRAYRVAAEIVQDRAAADAVVEDAFLALWRGRARYDAGRETVAGWVMATVRDRARDRTDLTVAARSGGHDACRRSALGTLAPAQREIVALAFFGELSAPEIAGVLALPEGTVKGGMRLGLDALRSP